MCDLFARHIERLVGIRTIRIRLRLIEHDQPQIMHGAESIADLRLLDGFVPSALIPQAVAAARAEEAAVPASRH